MSEEFEGRLQEMEDNWGQALSGEGGFVVVPTGIYRLQLQNAELTESAADRLMIVREWLVLDGEFSGEVVRDYMQLETERGPFFIQLWIDQMGYEVPNNPTEIPAILEAIVQSAAIVKGKVKVTTEGFTNVRIQSVEDVDGAPDISPAPTEDSVTPAEGSLEPSSDEDLKDELLAFCDSHNVPEIESGETQQEIIDVLNTYEWKRSELTTDEIALVETIGGFFEQEEEKPKPKPAPAKRKTTPAKPAKAKPKAKPAVAKKKKK